MTVAVASFHPTTTTFKFPAVCASVYTTATAVCGLCGVVDVLCTKAMEARACPANPIKTRKQAPRVRPKRHGERRSLKGRRHEGMKRPIGDVVVQIHSVDRCERATARIESHCP